MLLLLLLLLLAAGLTAALPAAHELAKGPEQQQRPKSRQGQQDCKTGSTHMHAAQLASAPVFRATARSNLTIHGLVLYG
jgi:hypothetical protein